MDHAAGQSLLEIVKTWLFMLPASNSDVEILRSKTILLTLDSCTIYLYAANDPVIEASSGLRFAPFNIGYPHLREQAAKA